MMSTLTVASLAANVPLDEGVDYICSFAKTEQVLCGIATQHIKDLLLKYAHGFHFLFGRVYYWQKDGAAIDSPLGPSLADATLAAFEQNELSSTASNDGDVVCTTMMSLRGSHMIQFDTTSSLPAMTTDHREPRRQTAVKS